MKQQIGFEINIPEGSRIVRIPVSKDLQKYFKEELFAGKSHINYLKEFLVTKKSFNMINAQYLKFMEEALPQNVKTECLYCQGKSDDEGDKACQKYYLQMQVTFVAAANEFVRLILAHKFIYENKKALYNVTINFFQSLVFIKGQGKMYFNLDAICRHILNAGFISLSEMFAKSEPLNNLKIINDSISNLEYRKLENELYNKEDEDYLDLQHKFFENKQRYYKEQLFLQEREPKEPHENIKQNKNDIKKTSIPAYALYYFYLQEAKDFPNFDNHPQGKVKAIEELIEKDKIETSSKNFQLEYNKIANHKSNRIAKNKAKTILFVANELLKNYPNAQKIALEEYELATNKNR